MDRDRNRDKVRWTETQTQRETERALPWQAEALQTLARTELQRLPASKRRLTARWGQEESFPFGVGFMAAITQHRGPLHAASPGTCGPTPGSRDMRLCAGPQCTLWGGSHSLYLSNTLCFQKVNTMNTIKIVPHSTVSTSTIYKYREELHTCGKQTGGARTPELKRRLCNLAAWISIAAFLGMKH